MDIRFQKWDVVKLKHGWLPMTVESYLEHFGLVNCVFFSMWWKIYRDQFMSELLEHTQDRLDTLLKVKTN